MLGHSGTKCRDSPTKFKLFEPTNVTGPSDSIPQGPQTHSGVTSCSRKTPHMSDDANGNESDSSSPPNEDCLPPLPANEALAQAVSQVKLSMDEWPSLHVFKLLVVLVEPPPGLDLSAVEGLPEYLTQLLVEMGNIIENGIRKITTHCWWVLLGKCSTPNIPRV